MHAIRELAKVAERFPQAAYAGLQKSLQHEWQFLQRVTKGLGNEFSDVEQALHHNFLPALFGQDSVDDPLRQLASLPVKKAGLAIPNPTLTAESNWTSSTVICGHLVAAIRGRVEFRSADHQQIRSAGIKEMKKRQLENSKESLDAILTAQPARRSQTIRRGEQTGAWLSVLPSTVNGTELLAQ